MNAKIVSIQRYPVKSLGGEAVAETALVPDRGVAGDRRYALVPAADGEPEAGWRPKSRCVALVRHASLARLAARFDDASGAVALSAAGRELARGRPEAPGDRARLEAVLDRELSVEIGMRFRLAAAGPDTMLSDVNEPFIALVNLASTRALGEKLGAPVDPIRFRGNFHLEGVPAWAEREWIGRRIAIGDAVLEVMELIGRCAATEVNPATAARDLRVLRGLADGFGHTQMGVYAKVAVAGKVTAGAPLREIA